MGIMPTRKTNRACFFGVILCVVGCTQYPAESPAGAYQATGFKIGELTHHSAIIWTRLTLKPERVGTEAPMPVFLYRVPNMTELQKTPPGRFHPHDWVPIVRYEEGSSINNIEGAVVGSPGEVRVGYRPIKSDNWQLTEWETVDPEHDFIYQFTLLGLAPGTEYELLVEGRTTNNSPVTSALSGQFRTAPIPDEPARVVFGSTTGTDYEDQDAIDGGFRIHRAMMNMEVDFFVHTGDIVYYDDWAKNLDLARWGWGRMFSLPTNMDFHRQIPTYFMKDDHDAWQDDTWPTQQSSYMGEFSFQDGVEVFKEQVPIGDNTYRTFRWGKDLQIWLVEGRDYRSANTDPDGLDKTIWGTEQKAWFEETVAASDATFRILISPTPVVGPDNLDKSDSHANEGFGTEGEELRRFLAKNNMIVICGDRHWQYVSVDEKTGLREYATGAASDAHAGGWIQGDVRPEHLYVNVVGGFLSVTAERQNLVPTLTLRNHNVDGEILFEDRLIR